MSVIYIPQTLQVYPIYLVTMIDTVNANIKHYFKKDCIQFKCIYDKAFKQLHANKLGLVHLHYVCTLVTLPADKCALLSTFPFECNCNL